MLSVTADVPGEEVAAVEGLVAGLAAADVERDGVAVLFLEEVDEGLFAVEGLLELEVRAAELRELAADWAFW